MRSQDWIVPDGFCARLLFATVMLLLAMPQARAQQGNPEVYVDMSVLQGLGNAPAQPQEPVQLKPPVLHQQPYSRLTAPAPLADTPSAPVPLSPSAISPSPLPVAKQSPQAQDLQQAIRGETEQQPEEVPPVRPVVASPPAVAKPQPRPYVSTPPQVPADPIPAPATPSPVKDVDIPPPSHPATTAQPAKVVTFPVKTHTKDETSDPSAPHSPSRPVPVRSGIAGNLNDVVPSRPAPDLDPAVPAVATLPVRDLTEGPPAADKPASSTAKPAPVKKPLRADIVPARKPQIEMVETMPPAEAKVAEVAAIDGPSLEKPPIPPRRPETKQAVSPEIVAALIQKEQAKVKSDGAMDLVDPPPPPGPKGKKNMPAVVAGAVDAEPLSEQIVKLPVENDPLLDRLLEKDKDDLVKTIETLVEQREDNMPAGDKIVAKKPDAGSSIFKAEPIQRPYNVYRPEKAKQQREAAQDQQMLASLKADDTGGTASEIVPRPPQPRSENEQAYVSLPFTDGRTDLDEPITKEIELKLLPLLNDNPAWKLQIQAFASPVKDGTSSARKASLARAMAVRSFLLGKGIEATRMDVRALGAESDRDPLDRVDLVVFDPAKKRP